MYNSRFLPLELEKVVGSEKIDFSVFAERNKPVRQSLILIMIASIWLAVT